MIFYGKQGEEYEIDYDDDKQIQLADYLQRKLQIRLFPLEEILHPPVCWNMDVRDKIHIAREVISCMQSVRRTGEDCRNLMFLLGPGYEKVFTRGEDGCIRFVNVQTGEMEIDRMSKWPVQWGWNPASYLPDELRATMIFGRLFEREAAALRLERKWCHVLKSSIESLRNPELRPDFNEFEAFLDELEGFIIEKNNRVNMGYKDKR